jgi:hypothetical protein
VSKRLIIPVTRLIEWRKLKQISVQGIDGGWKLNIYSEPARTEITKAQLKQRLKLIKGTNELKQVIKK